MDLFVKERGFLNESHTYIYTYINNNNFCAVTPDNKLNKEAADKFITNFIMYLGIDFSKSIKL